MKQRGHFSFGLTVKTYPYKAMMTPFEKLKSLDEIQ